MSNTPAVDIDENNDEPEMYVVDSEEYQKTKKLQSIHRSKQEFKNAWKNNSGFSDKQYRIQLAQTLVMYGSELYPLIQDAISTGLLKEDDVYVNRTGRSVLYQIEIGFRTEADNNRVQSPATMIEYFRHLEGLQRKLGLGLEIETESQPAQI